MNPNARKYGKWLVFFMYQKSLVGNRTVDHLDGMDANQIAKKYGCDHATIVMWLKRNDIFRKATREANLREKELMLKLYKTGHSLPEIARKVGFSHETVRYWVLKAGLVRTIKEAKQQQCYRSISPLPLTTELAFLLGIHAGDGSLGAGRKNITRWRYAF